MRKNRLIWNIALFLVIIVAIPIAYAQAFTGSSWFFILINSAIVGVILFLLQSFLIPGKDPKEKTAVWVAIVVGSLLIGFFFGRSGFIWNHPVFARFFSVYVLVNSIIIGAALYFLSGFLDINKKLGTEGKGGLGILIFLIALVFAVQIGDQWIWQQNVVKQLVDYLFGAQGLLNPKPPEYRLWAFITVTTLLSFFFKGYLLKGGAGGTDKVNYALAILIGSSVARAGISFQSIVLLGEAIFTIVLADALKDTAPKIKTEKAEFSTNWILAGFLVGWASAAMTYGTEYQGWLATFVGYPLWVLGLITVGSTGAPTQPTGFVGWISWIGKMGGGALIFAVIALIFLFVIFRGRIRREGMTRLGEQILKRIKRTRWGAQLLGDYYEVRSRTLDREIPFILKDLRFELYAFWNFLLRFEIYKLKHGFMKAIIYDPEKGIEKKEEILGPNVANKDDIFKSMKVFIEGSPIIPSEDKWILQPIFAEDEDGNVKEDPVIGFANQQKLIYDVMTILKSYLEADIAKISKFNAGGMNLKAAVDEFEDDVLGPHKIDIKSIYFGEGEKLGRFKRVVTRFGAYNYIRGKRLYFLDMYNYWGTYIRGYHFPKPDAIPDLYSPAIEDDDGINRKTDKEKRTKVRSVFSDAQKNRFEELKNKEENKLPDMTPAEKAELKTMRAELRKYNFVTEDMLEEADIYGFSTRDQNDIILEGKNGFNVNGRGYIRRWKKEDMWELHQEKRMLPRIAKLMSFSEKEWGFLVNDMEKGRYHPYSKGISDYNYVLKGNLNFDLARFSRPLKITEIAFDREALKNPSKLYSFWGKKNYFDEREDLLIEYPASPYPVASIVGFWKVIWDVASKHIKELENEKKYKAEFSMEFRGLETGAPASEQTRT